MEEMNNMTAERSLEIITEQIEQSRRTASKRTGQSLFVSGLCTMGMAIVVAVVNLLLINAGFTPLAHLLWFVLPVIIWLALRNVNRRSEPAPMTLISSLVGKTWWTFAVFVLGFFLTALLWNKILIASVSDPSAYLSHRVNITPIIILLMGMAVTMTGHILKSKWLVWFGIIAGLLVSVGDYASFGSMLLARMGASVMTVGQAQFLFPCMSVFIFALVGLMLPGLMLKKQQ